MPPYDAWNTWCSICESPQAVKSDSSVSQTVICSSSGNSAVKSEQIFHAFPYELLPECTAINITGTHQLLLWRAPEQKGQLHMVESAESAILLLPSHWNTAMMHIHQPSAESTLNRLSHINFWKEHRHGPVNPDIWKMLEYVDWTGGVLPYPATCQCHRDKKYPNAIAKEYGKATFQHYGDWVLSIYQEPDSFSSFPMKQRLRVADCN